MQPATSEVMNRHPFFHVQKHYDKSGRIFWGCGNPHTFVCSKTPSVIGKSGQNVSLVYVRVLTVPGTWSPFVCPCKTDFWSFRRVYARTRVRNSIMTVIWFRSSRFSDKALSETTSACQKQQMLVGNDKRLLETTNACRKQQTLVRNDKA